MRCAFCAVCSARTRSVMSDMVRTKPPSGVTARRISTAAVGAARALIDRAAEVARSDPRRFARDVDDLVVEQRVAQVVNRRSAVGGDLEARRAKPVGKVAAVQAAMVVAAEAPEPHHAIGHARVLIGLFDGEVLRDRDQGEAAWPEYAGEFGEHFTIV